jgi:lupus La protein
MTDATAKKVLKQVEFYFGNSNLPRDKFLLGEVKKTKEGWVSLATIASFKRMKQLTEDIKVVEAALRESKELLEVSEDGAQIRRKTPLPDSVDDLKCSIYAKGFPADSTIDSVTEFFEKQVAEGQEVRCVRLRRIKGKDKTFKGSVFVEFSSEAEAQRVGKLELKLEQVEEKKEEGEAAKEGDGKLIVMLKEDYINKKKEEAKERRAKKGGDSGKKRKADDEAKPPAELVYKNDLIVELKELKADTENPISREDLKALLEKVGAKVKFVDFSRGQTQGFVRLSEDSELTATAAAKKITDDKEELGGAVPTCSVLEGDAEKEYYTKVAERKANSKKGKFKGGRNKRQRR